MTPTIVSEPIDLKNAWAKLREENSHLRIREAAEKLNVSEAELLATQIGERRIQKCRSYQRTRKDGFGR
jgi:putative heme degradation protein